MGFTNQQIVSKMKELGLVPLFTHDDVAVAQQVIEAAYRGGVRVFEFTNRKKNSFEVFVAMLDYCKKFPDLMLGIGTVMDGATTKKFIDAGAHFIISPILKLEMAEVCRADNILWMPGCATLTEIVTAKEHGAQVIKVFPGSVLGPGFVSSIMPVVPDLQLMITGGVEPNEKNLTAWFKAGAMSVGMGSQLFTKDILEKKDWAALEKSVSDILQTIRKIKS
ncbi:bifunctional 4-hydroxy-2-oxoglutarate aldolase/2-dehydro-3-deoxy-phosphogluconate aldolase [Chryseolinea sp. H1M3-3]|uniref:bifunctional 4-hydroxy-2-oxoglutarate aldolase/2-dehydro-3-deoxy-phosphogluconate aldolase n=1 Tax=Chryseolinea sp. H1M3-3 TaxID=3034144 RepID=UPI0023ECC6B0|nr:bifunctional 4-hydroxy-2-oxoglutarate aldolase/2-dehydro-3-deoxy-phosphogluconate aldolase [Chryseolinea sp. H1M3-3]